MVTVKDLILIKASLFMKQCLVSFHYHCYYGDFVCLCLGEPVQCTAWAGQCALYIIIMMFEKVVITLVLLIPQWKKVSNTHTKFSS